MEEPFAGKIELNEYRDSDLIDPKHKLVKDILKEKNEFVLVENVDELND